MSEDEVDELISDWRRERPELDVEVMQIWSRISRVAAIFEQGRRAVFYNCQLDGWEFDVLAALRKTGTDAALTPGELLRLTHVTSGTMTNRIERLRSRGLVTRTASAGDRRSAVISLTPAGQERIDEAIASLLEWENQLLEGFTDGERTNFTELLSRAQVALSDR